MSENELEILVRVTERFWSHVQRGESCWEWRGDQNQHGHGKFATWVGGKRRRMYAHRLSFILSGRPLADDEVVRHACDNPPCVNPAHLLKGTQRDNILDSIERGRADLSGLTRACDHECRLCGKSFSGTPQRRYCDECQQIPERKRSQMVAIRAGLRAAA